MMQGYENLTLPAWHRYFFKNSNKCRGMGHDMEQPFLCETQGNTLTTTPLRLSVGSLILLMSYNGFWTVQANNAFDGLL